MIMGMRETRENSVQKLFVAGGLSPFWLYVILWLKSVKTSFYAMILLVQTAKPCLVDVYCQHLCVVGVLVLSVHTNSWISDIVIHEMSGLGCSNTSYGIRTYRDNTVEYSIRIHLYIPISTCEGTWIWVSKMYSYSREMKQDPTNHRGIEAIKST